METNPREKRGIIVIPVSLTVRDEMFSRNSYRGLVSFSALVMLSRQLSVVVYTLRGQRQRQDILLTMHRLAICI